MPRRIRTGARRASSSSISTRTATSTSSSPTAIRSTTGSSSRITGSSGSRTAAAIRSSSTRWRRCPACTARQAADLDGDGDLDIVAAALLAGGSDVDEKTLPALAWLEQTKPGVFARHTIEMGFPRHATLDLGDIDGDGDLDIVTGNFSIEPVDESGGSTSG